MSQDLKEDFRAALAKEPATNIDRIEFRSCSSDKYDGVQYDFYGHYIPVRPIISMMAEVSGFAIEQMQFANDTEEPHLGIFVAEIPEQEHPAFIN